MKKILIVEDDKNIQDIIIELIKDKYEGLRAFNVSSALTILEKEKIDLIILDLMLPGVGGEELIKKLKNIPIIVLSAKLDVDDKVNCFDLGANDYLTKPFNSKELKARIDVQLRDKDINSELKYKELSLMQDRPILVINENEVNLTKSEYLIIKELLSNPRQVITKNKLLDLINFDLDFPSDGTLRVHISNLRKKIRKYTKEEYIESVFGIGFKIKE